LTSAWMLLQMAPGGSVVVSSFEIAISQFACSVGLGPHAANDVAVGVTPVT
jgi:hypothetical protein